ncbi:flagellar basal-body MS-ring/collar protein FliF [Paracoccus litorisediminis]|uniref:flagellar basal-body MS-ring/collar protein FliF n=1 Tax=Paracoccus litorisediminis TaxID=2006130 RepID=UPI00372DAF46
MKQIIENLQGLGQKRLIALGLVGTGIVAALLLGLTFAMQPQYRPIATDITAAEASSMVAALEQAGFEPRISTDGTMISVAESDMARARMALAESGMPANGAAGWELFDNTSGIGMNSFLQRVNRLRALEGELARSIATIDNVEMARVHLVLPERETFSQDRPDPTASVIVKTRRGLPMERRQALAVRNLVSAAVPGLSPEHVTVLSNSGDTILGSEDMGSGVGIATTRATLEDRYARNVEAILSARVGAGNVRVRVAADLATAREVVVTQAFDPEQQVARRVDALAEKSNSTEGSRDAVDVATNMPGTPNGSGAGAGRNETRSKTQDTTDYEIGSTRSERVTEAGGVKRLTVAVLVNGTVTDGTYAERDKAELEQIAALVKSAIGYDETRGDVVTVESLQFIDDAGYFAENEGSGFLDILAQNSGTILRGLIALVGMAILLAFGLRPYLRKVGDIEARPALPMMNPAMTDPARAEALAASLSGDVPMGVHDEEMSGEYVALASVSGNLTKRNIEDLMEMVDGNREKAINTLRVWINQKA